MRIQSTTQFISRFIKEVKFSGKIRYLSDVEYRTLMLGNRMNGIREKRIRESVSFDQNVHKKKLNDRRLKKCLAAARTVCQ